VTSKVGEIGSVGAFQTRLAAVGGSAPAQRLEPPVDYEAACERSEGGAYLRRKGLYSSLISEWRRLRDAGILAGKQPGAKLGCPSAEQAEIARLRRQLAERERRLVTTETALEIMGKAHALLEQISQSAATEDPGSGCPLDAAQLLGHPSCRTGCARAQVEEVAQVGDVRRLNCTGADVP